MMVENRYKIPPFFMSLVGSGIYDKKAAVQLVPEYDWSSDLLEKMFRDQPWFAKEMFWCPL